MISPAQKACQEISRKWAEIGFLIHQAEETSITEEQAVELIKLKLNEIEKEKDNIHMALLGTLIDTGVKL